MRLSTRQEDFYSYAFCWSPHAAQQRCHTSHPAFSMENKFFFSPFFLKQEFQFFLFSDENKFRKMFADFVLFLQRRSQKQKKIIQFLFHWIKIEEERKSSWCFLLEVERVKKFWARAKLEIFKSTPGKSSEIWKLTLRWDSLQIIMVLLN